MPAVSTVSIRYATGGLSIPGKIGSILSERSAETDIGGGIHTRIGAFIKIMQAVLMCVSHRAIMRKKYIIRIF